MCVVPKMANHANYAVHEHLSQSPPIFFLLNAFIQFSTNLFEVVFCTIYFTLVSWSEPNKSKQVQAYIAKVISVHAMSQLSPTDASPLKFKFRPIREFRDSE